MYRIHRFSKLTGLSTHLIRAWERRYGLLAPERTPKGHRLYSAQDVRLVEHILTLLEEGHSLPAIARQLRQGVGTSEPGQDRRVQVGIWPDYLNSTLQDTDKMLTRLIGVRPKAHRSIALRNLGTARKNPRWQPLRRICCGRLSRL